MKNARMNEIMRCTSECAGAGSVTLATHRHHRHPDINEYETRSIEAKIVCEDESGKPETDCKHRPPARRHTSGQ